MSCIIDVLGPPPKKWPLEGDEWDSRYEELNYEGWSRVIKKKIATITRMPDGEIWMLTIDGEVIAWRFHRDVETAMFISITRNVDVWYKP
jgi:hypothetical protein